MSTEPLGGSPALVENSEPVVVETPEPKTEAASTPQPDPAPKRDRAQERIDELTWRVNEERRRREALEREIAQRPKEQPAPAKPPTLEDHGFDQAKYDQAFNEYQERLIEQKTAEKVAKALADRDQQAQQETRLKTFAERQDAFAKTNPDYVTKVQLAETLPISEASQEMLQDMDLGPQVALYLVDNREEALKIMQLPERQQALALGRIEAKLATPKVAEAPPPKVSQAPPPPAKIEATEATVEKRPEDMSDSEFAKWRRRQIAQRR